MICIPLAGLVSLLQFLGLSVGVLGILAAVGECCDGYAGDQASTVQQGEAKGD